MDNSNDNDTILLADIAMKLKPINWDILSMLSKQETLTYSEIKGKLKTSQDKTTKEIARLEGALLVQSGSSDTDERKKVFSITSNGVSIMRYRK